MEIIKASGEKEKFSKEKLYRSLRRAGVQPGLAERVCRDVRKKVQSGMNTKQVHNQTFRYLKKEDSVLAARYNLKRAIMELGPTGFPFEKYVAEILREYGYFTKVGEIVKGYCVNHEVDVIARKGNKHFIVECKYHNRPGIKSDVKVAMYTYGRFLDIKNAWEKIKDHSSHFHQVWLVTNTKCTSQAIQYARCVGLKIISWRYPRNESLEYLIESKGLYPITILPSLTRYAKERLSQKRIMLAKDLLKYSVDDLVQITALPENTAKKLQEEAKQLCLC